MSGKTRAELFEQIDDLKARLTASEARTFVAPPLKRVPEADALAGCIRAMELLPTRSTGYANDSLPDYKSVERLLRMLASKYGVNLIEVQTEPCHLVHLTGETRGQINMALQSVLS